MSSGDLAVGQEVSLELVFGIRSWSGRCRDQLQELRLRNARRQCTRAVIAADHAAWDADHGGHTPLGIERTINDASAQLTVNGERVSHSGGRFAANVALQEGHNAIVARAVTA